MPLLQLNVIFGKFNPTLIPFPRNVRIFLVFLSFLFDLHLKSQVQPCWLVKTFSASPHEDLGHYSPGAEARYSTPIIKHSCRFLNIANVCFIVVVNLSHLHNFRPQVGFSSLVQKAVECTGRHRCCS